MGANTNGKPTTAERMRARKVSLHFSRTIPAVGHMPFAGHRPLSEIGGMRELLRSEQCKIKRLGAYKRRYPSKIKAAYGFDPESLKAAR